MLTPFSFSVQTWNRTSRHQLSGCNDEQWFHSLITRCSASQTALTFLSEILLLYVMFVSTGRWVHRVQSDSLPFSVPPRSDRLWSNGTFYSAQADGWGLNISSTLNNYNRKTLLTHECNRNNNPLKEYIIETGAMQWLKVNRWKHQVCVSFDWSSTLVMSSSAMV